MEKDNRDGSEVISVASADSRIIGESERVEVESRGDSGDTRRTRSDRGRRVKLRRRKQRDSQGGDSDDTARDAGADAGADANEEIRDDEENTIRVEQYPSESRRSSRKREKSESKKKKAIKLEDAVEQFLDTTFSVVSVLSGEPHWALEPAEREMLSDAVVNYIEAQDKRTLQKLKKVAGKYFPAINLAVVSFAIVYPRVLQSKIFSKKI